MSEPKFSERAFDFVAEQIAASARVYARSSKQASGEWKGHFAKLEQSALDAFHTVNAIQDNDRMNERTYEVDGEDPK